MTLRKRTVETGLGKGQRGRLWAYGYPDLSRLLEVTEGHLRNQVSRRRFDPGDLLAVARAICRVKGAA